MACRRQAAGFNMSDLLERAARIYAEALERPPDERDEFVAQACEQDPALRREVEAFFDQAAEAAEFADALVGRADAISPFVSASVDKNKQIGAAGESIGPYRLIEPLGQGGMSTVWRAERADGLYEGEVAVKLLSRGVSLLKGFDREAHHLAKLTHPNIARLVDAGVRDDDVPFLIIDLVDGQEIDQYCDDHSLTIEQRVRLFITVIEAVAHAHSRLIVHNDIKPGNVLVTAGGEAKLLDFGIATLLSDSEGGRSAALTPDFAAPEQFVDAGVTTASDVYALGLVFYQILTGTNPRSLGGVTTIDGLREKATESAPPLADTLTRLEADGSKTITVVAGQRRASPTRLVKTLRSELDDIVRKALAVEPRERYSNAAEFADDLKRYLGKQPVQAHPDSVGYRARKFVDRHRGGVLGAMLTFVLLVAAAVVTTLQSMDAKQQRAVAERERDAAIYQTQRSQASYEFLTLLLGELGSPDEPLNLQQLLDRGVEMIDNQFGSDEKFVAHTLYNVSVLYASIGQVDRQLELLNRAEAIARDNADAPILATVLCARARMNHVADLDSARNDIADALTLISVESTTQPLECFRASGLVHSTEGEFEQAIDQFEQALAQVDADPAASSNSKLILMNDLVEQYMKIGRTGDALTMLDGVIRENANIGRGGTITHVIYLANRATLLTRLGEVATANDSFREAYERVQTMDEPLIGISVIYGGNLQRLQRHDAALEVLQPGYDAANEVGNERWLAQAAMLIGLVHVDRGEQALGQSYLRQAREFFDATPAAHRRHLVRLGIVEADRLLLLNDISGAQRITDSLLENLGYPDGGTGGGLSDALIASSRVALKRSDVDAALQYANDAVQIATDQSRDTSLSADAGLALEQRALVHEAADRMAESRADLRRALTSLENGFGSEHPATRRVRDRL